MSFSKKYIQWEVLLFREGLLSGFYEIFTLWRVHVGYVNSEVLPEHWVGNNGKGQAKDGDGTANVGDVSQGLLVAVG